MQPSEDKLLHSRTAITSGAKEVLNLIAIIYKLAPIENLQPIQEGYEDANYLLTTQSGKFVVKFFAKDKTEESITSYVSALIEGKKIGVPLVNLRVSNTGYVAEVEDTKIIVMDYFDGNNFSTHDPTLGEIKSVSRFLSLFNTLNFPVSESYDSWGNNNLLVEWAANNRKLSHQTRIKVKKVVSEISNINLSGMKKGVIHADTQKKHVLKNARGKYCLIDLGCMRNDYLVYEISTFIAWFCLSEDNRTQWDDIFNLVVKIYKERHALKNLEILVIKPLIRASFAAYLLKTDHLIMGGDDSPETKDWNNKARGLLKLSMGWK